MEPINKIFSDLMQMPYVRVGFILAGSMAAALFARLIFTRLILSWSKKTRTQVDNRLADVLHGPVVYSIILAGIALIYKTFNEAGIEIPYPKQDVYIKQMPEIK